MYVQEFIDWMRTICSPVVWKGIEGDARGFHKEVRKRALKLKNLRFTHGGGRTFSVGSSCGGYCVRNKALPKLEEAGPA